MTDEERAKIRERVEKATVGPWNADFTDDDFQTRPRNGCTMRDGRDWAMVWVEEAENKDDILFMMYAREDIPKLLADVERLRAQNAALLEIAQAMVTYESFDREDCWFCGHGPIHLPQCPVVKARALLAAEG